MSHDTPLFACRGCGKEFPRTLEFFPKAPVCFDGLNTRCRECRRAYEAAYRDANREKDRAKSRRYEAANREKRREKDRTYYRTHKETVAEKNARFRAANPDYFKEHARLYRERFPERARVGRWNRRAAQAGVSGRIELEDVQRQRHKQGGLCFYCNTPLGPIASSNLTVDHFIPLARGGEHSAGNIVCSCRDCNTRKTDKMPWEFMPERFPAPEAWDAPNMRPGIQKSADSRRGKAQKPRKATVVTVRETIQPTLWDH